MSEDLVNSQDNIKGLKERLSKQMEEKNQLEMMKAAKTKEKVNTAWNLISSLPREKDYITGWCLDN